MRFKKLHLVLLDFFDHKVLYPVRAVLESELNIQTALLKWETLTGSSPSEFRNGSRYRSTEMINFFSENLHDGIEKILFLTTDDLYSPVFASYFGEAQFNGRVGIVSTYLLRENLDNDLSSDMIFLSRFEKVAVHEGGHLFGLKHCKDINCVMKLSGRTGDLDMKSPGFCVVCTEVLINSTLAD